MSLLDWLLSTLTVFVPGVRVLAVGLGQADTGELRQAVTGGNAENIFYVRDAAQLDSLHTGLADALCLIARTQEASGNRSTFLNCSSFLNRFKLTAYVLSVSVYVNCLNKPWT